MWRISLDKTAVAAIVIGAITIYGSLDFRMGTLANIGPGLYPLILGVGLVILGGLGLTGEQPASIRDKKKAHVTWEKLRGPAFALLSMVAFLFCYLWFGFAVASATLLIIASCADRENSKKTTLILSAIVTVAVTLVFPVALGIPFSIFW